MEERSPSAACKSKAPEGFFQRIIEPMSVQDQPCLEKSQIFCSSYMMNSLNAVFIHSKHFSL